MTTGNADFSCRSPSLREAVQNERGTESLSLISTRETKDCYIVAIFPDCLVKFDTMLQVEVATMLQLNGNNVAKLITTHSRPSGKIMYQGVIARPLSTVYAIKSVRVYRSTRPLSTNGRMPCVAIDEIPAGNNE